MNNKFNIKVYDKTGTNFLKTISSSLSDIGARNSEIINQPTFRNVVGGGQGQTKITLNVPLNDYGEGDWVDYMNVVRIYVVNDLNPAGKLVYSGIIYAYTPFANEVSAGVELTILGAISLLTETIHRDGSNLNPSYSNVEHSVIIKDIIDKHKLIFPFSIINYTDSSLEDTGETISISFNRNSSFDAIKNVVQTIQSDFFLYVDENATVFFQRKPVQAVHQFTFGKDVASFSAIKDSKAVINKVYLETSGGTVTAEDFTSINEFGLRERFDARTGLDASSGQAEADSVVANNKDPRIRTTIVINNQYPIEFIRPGQSCKVFNLPFNSNIFTENMFIVGVQYNWDSASLELEEFGENLDTAVKILTQ